VCVIVAKYFPGTGWAGAKNRDRRYIPTLDFIEDTRDGISRMMMHDQITGYREGINSRGVSILNTSLDIGEDEPDVESGRAKTSPDGLAIAEALLQSDPFDAAKLLIKRRLVGCTMVFNAHTMYLIEASDQDGTRPYRYRVQLIPRSHTVARTNHGIFLPWASFQRRPDDTAQTQDRISSEARLIQAQQIVEQAQQPEDLVDDLCRVYINHPQLNVMRTSTETNQFRTTCQLLCVPRQRTLYCRPVSSNLHFDFWDLNRPDTNVWVEILSNRELWQNTRGDPPFGHMKMRDIA
jgi:hypothetical protein